MQLLGAQICRNISSSLEFVVLAIFIQFLNIISLTDILRLLTLKKIVFTHTTFKSELNQK